jgi:hypothetical protein
VRYSFRSIDGEHSENAQEMTQPEAIAHARRAADFVQVPIQIIRQDGSVFRTERPKADGAADRRR